MKMLTEYLERALQFEQMAGTEQNQTFKAELLKQAAAYRQLAAKRAQEYGLPMPSPPDKPCILNFARSWSDGEASVFESRRKPGKEIGARSAAA
jgi:hypothetical protein